MCIGRLPISACSFRILLLCSKCLSTLRASREVFRASCTYRVTSAANEDALALPFLFVSHFCTPLFYHIVLAETRSTMLRRVGKADTLVSPILVSPNLVSCWMDATKIITVRKLMNQSQRDKSCVLSLACESLPVEIQRILSLPRAWSRNKAAKRTRGCQ